MAGRPAKILRLFVSSILPMVLAGCYGDALVQVSGVVKDDSANPVAGAVVTLAPSPGSGSKSPPDQIVTDSSGRFDVEITFSPAASRRDFVLTVEKEGFLPYEKHFSDGYHRQSDVVLSPAGERP